MVFYVLEFMPLYLLQRMCRVHGLWLGRGIYLLGKQAPGVPHRARVYMLRRLRLR